MRGADEARGHTGMPYSRSRPTRRFPTALPTQGEQAREGESDQKEKEEERERERERERGGEIRE